MNMIDDNSYTEPVATAVARPRPRAAAVLAASVGPARLVSNPVAI